MSADANPRITVSEETLRAVLAEFKLDLLAELKNYVGTAAFSALETQVREIQLWRAGLVGQTTARRQVAATTVAWAGVAVALAVGLMYVLVAH